jgi:hypothetical protein
MISHRYKFIFTKISKTASDTIQLTLPQENSAHLGHWHLIDDIDERTKDYFKFTIVRNPWDRLVSFYAFCIKTSRTPAYNNLKKFKDFVLDSTNKYHVDPKWCKHSPALEKLLSTERTKERCRLESQLDWISDDDGKILVDFIGRFENLQEDFNIVCDKIGIPHRKLPHKNKTKHKHYTEYYDEETRQIVAELHAKDIEYFGYKFGE